jgi:hypothetical protein
LDNALGPELSFAQLLFFLRPSDDESSGLVFPALDPATIVSTEKEFHYGLIHNSCRENGATASCLDPHNAASIAEHISRMGVHEKGLSSVCHSQFTMKPGQLETILIYSHHADLLPDYSAVWGFCPAGKVSGGS